MASEMALRISTASVGNSARVSFSAFAQASAHSGGESEMRLSDGARDAVGEGAAGSVEGGGGARGGAASV
jgi:hypothetical protein